MAYTPRNPGERPDPAPMKPINPFPLIAMLVIVLVLIAMLGGYL
jgi:hypothetical protein